MKRPTLYFHSSSFDSQIVRLCLAEKGVPYRKRQVDTETKGAHLQPWYMHLNREADLPTFQHNEMTLSELVTICVYVNNHFPGPILIPIRASERERMEEWVRLFQQFPHQEFSLGVLTGREMRHAKARLRQWIRVAEKMSTRHVELEINYKQAISKFQKWESLAQDQRFIERTRVRVEKSLDQLDAQLANTKWLAGNDYSLADTLWTVLLARLEYLGLNSLWTNGQRENVESYYQRVVSRRSFAQAHIQRSPSPLSKVVRFLRQNWELLLLSTLMGGMGFGMMYAG